MIKKLFVSLFLVLFSLAGCNTDEVEVLSHDLTLSFPVKMEYTEVNVAEISIQEKKELGIDLIYSPDKSKYVLIDEDRLILGPKDKVILDTVGDAAVVFGGMSDRLYLFSESDGLRYYEIDKGKWNEVDWSFLLDDTDPLPVKEIRLVVAVDDSPYLVFELFFGYSEFYLADIEERTMEELPFSPLGTVLDQRDGLLLIAERDISEFRLNLFDIETMQSIPINLHLPLYDPKAQFLYDSNSITYNTTLTINDESVQNLVLFQIEPGLSIVLPVDTEGLKWNAFSTCLFNETSLVCLELEE